MRNQIISVFLGIALLTGLMGNVFADEQRAREVVSVGTGGTDCVSAVGSAANASIGEPNRLDLFQFPGTFVRINEERPRAFAETTNSTWQEFLHSIGISFLPFDRMTLHVRLDEQTTVLLHGYYLDGYSQPFLSFRTISVQLAADQGYEHRYLNVLRSIKGEVDYFDGDLNFSDGVFPPYYHYGVTQIGHAELLKKRITVGVKRSQIEAYEVHGKSFSLSGQIFNMGFPENTHVRVHVVENLAGYPSNSVVDGKIVSESDEFVTVRVITRYRESARRLDGGVKYSRTSDPDQAQRMGGGLMEIHKTGTAYDGFDGLPAAGHVEALDWTVYAFPTAPALKVVK